jgi:DNA-binding MarR family transcriptional regulator
VARRDDLDILGTFLRTVKVRPATDDLLTACLRLGSHPTISDLYRAMGLDEDRFAHALAEAEAGGLVRRLERTDRVVVEVTPSGRQRLRELVG